LFSTKVGGDKSRFEPANSNNNNNNNNNNNSSSNNNSNNSNNNDSNNNNNIRSNLAQVLLVGLRRPLVIVLGTPFQMTLRNRSAQFLEAAAPPQAEMAMVLGKFRVPMVEMVLADAKGDFETHHMVKLNRIVDDTSCATWLWQALGYTATCSNQRTPWQLPLILEIKAALRHKRFKRSYGGGYRGDAGDVLPKLIELNIRGRTTLVENNTKHLNMNLGDSVDLMNWFISQLWQDIQAIDPQGHQAAGYPFLAEAAQEEDVPNQQSVIEETLETLRQMPDIKGATWDKHNIRFRIFPRNQKMFYMKLQGSKGLKTLLLMDLETLRTNMNKTLDIIRYKLAHLGERVTEAEEAAEEAGAAEAEAEAAEGAAEEAGAADA